MTTFDIPAPVISASAPDGWMENSPSISDAALAVSGMNYAAGQGHNHFAGLRFVIDAAYFVPGAPVVTGAVGLYRHSALSFA